jgi:hypothetical protein
LSTDSSVTAEIFFAFFRAQSSQERERLLNQLIALDPIVEVSNGAPIIGLLGLGPTETTGDRPENLSLPTADANQLSAELCRPGRVAAALLPTVDLTAKEFIADFYRRFDEGFKGLSDREQGQIVDVIKIMAATKGFLKLPHLIILTSCAENILTQRRRDAYVREKQCREKVIDHLKTSLIDNEAALVRREAGPLAKKQRTEKRREKITELLGPREKPAPGDSKAVSQLAEEIHTYLKNNEPELVKKGRGLISVQTLRRELVKLLKQLCASNL